MVRIDDGKGKNGQAEVNAEQQLVTRSITEPEIEHASAAGKAYAWDSLELNIAAGDTMLYVQNTNDTPLILDRLVVNGSNVICFWDIGLGTATTAGSGTAVTGVNLNTAFAGLAAQASAFSKETAVADASVVARVKTPVDNTVLVPLTGMILAKNHYIQVNQETTSDSGSVILIGHYENPS